MILPAQTIRKLCFPPKWTRDLTPMISPFCERGVVRGRSYGLSGASYDVRVAESFWLWPFWGRLASTIERFAMPSDVGAEVKDKSSNARRFVLVQNTWIDPGWTGYLTLELTRLLPWPVRIKAGTPIAQLIFHRLEQPTDQPYRGKYQDQAPGAQPARDEAAE